MTIEEMIREELMGNEKSEKRTEKRWLIILWLAWFGFLAMWLSLNVRGVKFQIGFFMYTLSLITLPIGFNFERKKRKMGKKFWEAYDQHMPINNPADWMSLFSVNGLIGGAILMIIDLVRALTGRNI